MKTNLNSFPLYKDAWVQDSQKGIFRKGHGKWGEYYKMPKQKQ